MSNATVPTTDVFAEDMFNGSVALVTGGGTGIGRSIALGFARHGADVAIASREIDHLEPVAEEIREHGAQACATTVDVREYDEVDTMVETVIEELGGVDVLVNNAGANFLSPAESLTPEGWRAVVGTILDGTAYCTMRAGEEMLAGDGGAIVSIGATNSQRGAPYHAHSGAGKAGVHNLMQSVAVEWADRGVRANTVAPGIVETEGVKQAAGGGLPDSLRETIPMDRFGQPSDVAPLVLFLASPAAAYITGGYYAADGGYALPTVPY